ncbi:MAG: hypothetical protein HY960_08130 [Ignavibacteriae bacterium]|nr:hypothetical protein [Ignavibacteriota bacterium]
MYQLFLCSMFLLLFGGGLVYSQNTNQNQVVDDFNKEMLTEENANEMKSPSLGIGAIVNTIDQTTESFIVFDYFESHPIVVNSKKLSLRYVDHPNEAQYTVTGELDGSMSMSSYRLHADYFLWKDGKKIQQLSISWSGTTNETYPLDFRANVLRPSLDEFKNYLTTLIDAGNISPQEKLVIVLPNIEMKRTRIPFSNSLNIGIATSSSEYGVGGVLAPAYFAQLNMHIPFLRNINVENTVQLLYAEVGEKEYTNSFSTQYKLYKKKGSYFSSTILLGMNYSIPLSNSSYIYLGGQGQLGLGGLIDHNMSYRDQSQQFYFSVSSSDDMHFIYGFNFNAGITFGRFRTFISYDNVYWSDEFSITEWHTNNPNMKLYYSLPEDVSLEYIKFGIGYITDIHF